MHYCTRNILSRNIYIINFAYITTTTISYERRPIRYAREDPWSRYTTDEEGNQMIALLDLDQEIIVNEDWVDLELNEIVETWQKFNEIFGHELTEIAKKLMADFKTMSEEINKNICLMKRIQENIHILRNEFVQDTEGMQFFKKYFSIFCRMPAKIDMSESIDSARRCLEALDSIQRIFPELTDFNSTTEETPLEESRPFPNAWI